MAVAVPIISTFDNKGIRLAENAFGGLSKKALAMGTAVAGAFAGVAKGMYEMVQAAAEDEKSFTLLAQTLSKVTGASAAMSAQVDKQIGKMAMATGIADDKLRPALANLVRATGNLSLSQSALNQVMDLSVSKQIDMDAASNAVAKALAGNTTALVKMLPGLKGIIDNGSSAAEVLAAIDSQVGGAAAAAADTFAGKIQRLKVVLGEMAETVGSWLLPVISAVVDFINTHLVAGFTYLGDVVGPKVNGVMSEFARVMRDDVLPFMQTYVLPALRTLADVFYNQIVPAVMLVVKVVIEKLGAAFAMIQSKIEDNRESFNRIAATMQKVVTFITRYLVPAFAVVLGKALDVMITAMGRLIDMFARMERIAVPVAKVIAGAFAIAAKAIITIVNTMIDAVNLLIKGLNAIPGVGNLPLIPRIEMPDFSLDLGPTATGGFGPWGENRGAMPITVPGAGGIDVGPAIPPSASGGRAAAAPGAVDPLAGMTPEQIAAGRANADFFAMGLDNPIVRRGAPVTVNVNGGLATSAEIGQAVVDAIKQYTNVSGPVDIAVR